MGISYTHYTMVGFYLSGQMHDLYVFLEENGYKVSSEKRKEIKENGQFSDDLVEFLELGEIDIMMVNCWAGHDFVIGYHVKKESETSKYAKKFAKFFPNVQATFIDFTEIG